MSPDFDVGAGQYANSRKGALDYWEFEKVRLLCAESVSVQTIAFVLGRPVCDVQPVAACFPKIMRRSYSPPREEKPAVVFNAGGPAPRGPFLTIAGEVALEHGLSIADLRGPCRTRLIAHARQKAFWRLRQETDISMPHIGQWFGHRDHTTILHGVRAHQARLDAGVREAVAAFEADPE